MPPIVACTDLKKRYGAVEALRGLTFSVAAGGCVGLLGPNGAGKTTTLRILTGLAPASGGRAEVAGQNPWRQRDPVRRRIGYLAQQPAFYNWMTGLEFLQFVAAFFGISGRAGRDRAESLLKRVGLWDARRRAIGGYSGGMKQRLGIAQALINQPEIVFLDEPISQLDPVGRHEVLELIAGLSAETTVFMSSHVLADVERVAGRVIIINAGRVALDSGMDELRRQHAAPVYEIEAQGAGVDLGAVLRALPYVAAVRREGPVWRVAVNDPAAARARLPRAVLDAGAELIHYGIKAPTLEDVFLKVVGEP
jgi:ABC-2 type transport system ATP-binding protein